MAISKLKLSGSTNGRPIKVAATSSAGTLIHTATSTAGQLDEIWLWAFNSGAANNNLTIQWGGTSDPDDNLELAIPNQQGLLLIIPGWLLDGGAIVRAFAGNANEVMIGGFVNRIDQS